MRPFSVDLRERVLTDFLAGMNFASLARKYTTSAEWVRQFIRRHQATGEVAARPSLKKTQPFHVRHEAALRGAVAEQPDLTLETLRDRLGIRVSIGTLHKSLQALKISFKKKRLSPPNRTGPMSSSNGTSSTRSSRSGSIRTASSSSTKPASKPT
jgi:transposase